MRFRLLCSIFALCIDTPLLQPQDIIPPHIFYTDLQSGPAQGGVSIQGQDGGAFVTISGNGFGDIQASSVVTLSGVPAGRIVSWSTSKIVVQLSRFSKTGQLKVSVPLSGSSNSTPFEIRDGHIFYVSLSGRDTNSGSFASPWATVTRAVQAMRPGDITYVMSGITQTTLDSYHAALSIQRSGTIALPIALVSYPGADPTIGDEKGEEYGVRTPAIRSGPFDNWILAGFRIRGANTSLKLVGVTHWRIVNNDFSCPSGDGAAGCVEVAASNYIDFLGNTVHNAGRSGSSKRYQAVYFGTDSNHIDVGWNRILHNHSCRGLQFHSTPASANSGLNQYDLLIHDNEIADQVCDGINLATIDPSKGPIAVFNNIIHDVGKGPQPPDGLSNYACINSPGIVNHGFPGSGTVEIFNNTLVNCGAYGGATAGAISVGAQSPDLSLRNNIVKQAAGNRYLTLGTAVKHIRGSNNWWFGSGAGPEVTTANHNEDPGFMPNSSGFRLSLASPARRAGRACGLNYDFAGAHRDPTGPCSPGAYE
jgi:hypothetical protein